EEAAAVLERPCRHGVANEWRRLTQALIGVLLQTRHQQLAKRLLIRAAEALLRRLVHGDPDMRRLLGNEHVDGRSTRRLDPLRLPISKELLAVKRIGRPEFRERLFF